MIRRAVPYWWELDILRLAMESPLPPDYVVPEKPFDLMWMAFQGSNEDAWGSVLLSEYGADVLGGDDPDEPGSMIVAPLKHMRERYGDGFAWETFIPKLLIFLDSPFVGTRHGERPRNKSAFRRLQGQDPTKTQFVVLRSPEPILHEREDPSHPGHYTVRWMVRGHYRNQWYPSIQKHRTIWVRSYLKGPEDAPLKVAIYRVAR